MEFSGLAPDVLAEARESLQNLNVALRRRAGSAQRRDDQRDLPHRVRPWEETASAGVSATKTLALDGRFTLASGRTIDGVEVAYETRGACDDGRLQRGPDLPRAPGTATWPALRPGEDPARRPRLVGQHGRPRQADRHRQLLRRVLQRARRLLRHDRSQLRRPGHRAAVGTALPDGHDRGHGRRAGAAAAGARRAPPARRDRRLHGRHAGAGVGEALPGARRFGRGRRDDLAPRCAGDRLQRGGPARDPRGPRRSPAATTTARRPSRSPASASRA